MAKIVLTSLIIGLGAIAQVAKAQVFSPIVGFNTITALGNSDTRFSVPLHRPSAFQGVVESVSGSVITISGLPGWTANQFVYSAGVQTNTYYVSVVSGNKEGMYYRVTANAADVGTPDTTTLTVDTGGDVIDGGAGVLNGDGLQIIPYWTFATLCPGQQGVTATTSATGAGSLTRVLIPDLSTPGINLAANGIYYYYSGTGFGGPGWRRSGGGLTTIRDNDPISPDVYVIIRQDGVVTSAVVTATGTVPTGDRRYVLGTISPDVEQDNPVAVDVPVPVTLTQSNLFESGAFTGTASATGVGGDKLLVYDDAVAATNKAAAKTFYYYTGTSFGGAGWRQSGGGLTTIRNNDPVFQPGAGYIIRKVASPSPTSVVWTLPTNF
jgi:uncharacterized protein (TIGR02597 family)